MIIGSNKDRVTENIKAAAESGNLNAKVEIDDPNLSKEEKERLTDNFVKRYATLGYLLMCFCARTITSFMTYILNRDTEVRGVENIRGLNFGAFVTSNHFNPIDNTVVRKALKKVGYRRLYIVSQETNLAMKGIVGFLMNYSDIIPISDSREYISGFFETVLKEKLDKKDAVLIYPEEEMWFNYRKPRPPKRGAYYYAALSNAPIISCFVEIRDLPEKENNEFYKTRYIIHILKTIYPEKGKSVRENSKIMMETDYRQKTEAYERAYGKKLTYDFEDDDIAGQITA